MISLNIGKHFVCDLWARSNIIACHTLAVSLGSPTRFQYLMPSGTSGSGPMKPFPMPCVKIEGDKYTTKSHRAHEWQEGLHLVPLVIQFDDAIIADEEDRRVRLVCC